MEGKFLDYNQPSDSIESHLSAMDSPTHPWYLSTKAMFRVVNKATTSLTLNNTNFEQSLHGIIELTKFINVKTARGALYINLEKAQILIDKLDTIRSDQFVVINDGYDHHRTELSTALRNLEASITDQQKLAATYLSKKAMESQQHEGSRTIRNVARTTVQSTVNTLRSSINDLQMLYYDANVHHNNIVYELFHRIDMKLTETSTRLLLQAQPYVYAAYQRGSPIIASVTTYTQPYTDSITPLIEPVRIKVQQNNIALRQHPVVGTYITQLFDQAQNVLNNIQKYCVTPNPALLVQASSDEMLLLEHDVITEDLSL